MPISIGLVGLGAFGSSFADLFMSHPQVNRIALCDREPERVARFANRPDWQQKFHPRDAYILDDICQQRSGRAGDYYPALAARAPQCIQAMESGKHVASARRDQPARRREMPRLVRPAGETCRQQCTYAGRDDDLSPL